jgi:predicted dienelactone hydrolase
MSTARFNVGCRTIAVPDPVQGVSIPLRMLYPATAAERTERVGPYEIEVATESPAVPGRYPLVIISHGGGGSPLTHRGLAGYLVRAGFVVVLPEHLGNSRSDNRLEGTIANLENRPRHIRLVIDAVLGDDRLGAVLLRDQIALIGHSMGGYTALAVAGGRPTTGPIETPPPDTPRPVQVRRDRRVRALVLLAPACGWFWSDGALADLDLPILLRTAEKDEHSQHLHIEFIEKGIPDRRRLDHRVVPNAGHHAFHTPFPPSLSGPHFPPSQDPVGFDRAAYQPILHAEILAFLREVLAERAAASGHP